MSVAVLTKMEMWLVRNLASMGVGQSGTYHCWCPHINPSSP